MRGKVLPYCQLRRFRASAKRFYAVISITQPRLVFTQLYG